MDDIAHFDIAPTSSEFMNQDWQFRLANFAIGVQTISCKFKFRTTFLQILVPDNFSLPIVTSNSYSRQLFCRYWKLSFLTPFLQIVALDFFWHILQVIDPDNFSANCCSRQLFCRLLLQTIYFANLQIVATMLQLIVPDQFVANLQIKNQPDNPTQSDHFNHPDRPKHLKHLTTLATLTTPTTFIIFVLH